MIPSEMADYRRWPQDSAEAGERQAFGTEPEPDSPAFFSSREVERVFFDEVDERGGV
jgi:hypothetical protein